MYRVGVSRAMRLFTDNLWALPFLKVIAMRSLPAVHVVASYAGSGFDRVSLGHGSPK